MTQRYKQANKEAWLSLAITILYLIAWSFCGYMLSDSQGLFGLPIWFETACIFVPIGFVIVCYIVIKTQFKIIALDYNQSTFNNTQQK